MAGAATAIAVILSWTGITSISSKLSLRYSIPLRSVPRIRRSVMGGEAGPQSSKNGTVPPMTSPLCIAVDVFEKGIAYKLLLRSGGSSSIG